jgi:hypothetical protein
MTGTKIWLGLLATVALIGSMPAAAQQQQQKPISAIRTQIIIRTNLMFLSSVDSVASWRPIKTQEQFVRGRICHVSRC